LFYEPILSILVGNVPTDVQTTAAVYKLEKLARCSKFNFKWQW